MRNRIKRRFALLLAVLAIICAAAGCGTETYRAADGSAGAADSDAWMDAEDSEYFGVEDARDAEADYSKYEDNASSAKNGAAGEVSVSEGTGTGQYNTDPVPEGQQNPVEPEDAEVDKDVVYTCYLSISCSTIMDNMGDLKEGKESVVPADGVILAQSPVTFYKGESVFDILQRVTREQGIHLDYAFTPGYNSNYIRGINNLYERDCGDASGWMYSVNGWYPNYGCSRYAVQDKDVIQWSFTCDGGEDLGRNWMD